jgi:ferrous iron transport protein A
MSIVPLSTLRPGQTAVIDHLSASDDVNLKLIELGLCPGEEVRFVRETPLQGPIEIEIMHYRLCIRKSEGNHVLVRPS